MPVKTATSTSGDTPPDADGKMPIVRLPSTRLAPRFAAAITPQSRPPVSSTHPCRAISSPRLSAKAQSPAEAESPAPITPTTVRRTRTPSLSPQQKTEPGHCVHEQPALLPELIQEILDLLRSHLWAGHGDLVLDALPTEWPRATGERGREVEAEQ